MAYFSIVCFDNYEFKENNLTKTEISNTNFLSQRSQSQTQTDSDKFIQQKYIQVPYQVYMSFLEIQIHVTL